MGMLEQVSGDYMFFLTATSSDKGRDVVIWQPLLQGNLNSTFVPSYPCYVLDVDCLGSRKYSFSQMSRRSYGLYRSCLMSLMLIV